MSKVKMRCGRCGKSFTAPKGAKQIFCAECAAKERAARAATKTAPARPAAAPTQAPKISGPGAVILDPKLAAITPVAVPPDSGPFGSAARAAEREAARAPHGAHGAHGHDGHEHPAHGHDHAREQGQEGERKPRPFGPPKAAKTEHGERGDRAPKSATPRPPKAPKAPKPAMPAFELTDELRQRIEARYLELSNPVEFDGIRTRIATELQAPKSSVKKVVAELRERMQLPSWWDLRAYRGSDEDLERIRAAYLPLLPVPAVGAHKQIASGLDLDPMVVYQGIRRIRAEMRLPQFNAPELHEQPQGATTAPAAGSLGTS